MMADFKGLIGTVEILPVPGNVHASWTDSRRARIDAPGYSGDWFTIPEKDERPPIEYVLEEKARGLCALFFGSSGLGGGIYRLFDPTLCEGYVLDVSYGPYSANHKHEEATCWENS